MNRMLVKNTMRDIRKTKARFISIMLIIMLSVGFLVGINSVAPSMKVVAQKYYSESNLMDFRLISTVGFTNEDIEAVADIEGVEVVMPSYFTDVFPVGETGDVVRIYAVPQSYNENELINTLTVREGRLPEKADEIVIGASRFGDFDIGSKISFTAPTKEDDLSDTLNNTEFEIVGIVDSPMYISFERGSTNVGSGKVAAYMMIPCENFLIERYTDLYVAFSSLRGIDSYSAEYEEIQQKFLAQLQTVGDLRIEAFDREEIACAQASIDEARATLEAEKTQAEKEIADAQNKIDEGYSELSKEEAQGRNALEKAKADLDAGKKELEEKKTEFNNKVSCAKEEIANSEQELLQGETQIKNAKSQFKESLFLSISPLGITREQYESFYGGKDMLSTEDVELLAGYLQMYRTSISSQLSQTQDALAKMEQELVSAGVVPESDADYLALKAHRDNLQTALSATDEFLNGGKAQLVAAIETIKAQEDAVAFGKQELENAKARLAESEAYALAEFDAAQEAIRKGEEEYSNGLAQLNASVQKAKDELAQAQRELNEKKAEAEEAFLKAEKEIDDAQKKLDEIEQPQWYYQTRSDNPGYDAYVEDVERVNAVGKVFPIFFMLVAILVCVTTMSRLIEEQRGDIGALTTLGYRRKDIISKYVIYALSATIIGSALGMVWGLPTIPYVIFNAYRMLYSSMPDLILTINTGSAVLAVLAAMVCTSSVAFVTCYSLLRKKPATLLRPKAPKPGKRILLERVGFVWNRLGFFSKVTVRNIFRYKARFFMTVIGVAGCTALIFAALGLYSSINDVVDKQFGEIFNYDVIVALEDTADALSVKRELAEDSRIESVTLCRQNLATVSVSDRTYTDDTYICVPENTQDFLKVVSLHQRLSGDKVDFGTSGVILTEKLAKNLGVTVGDKVKVADKGITAELTVEGICENYLYGYVYVTREVYEANFGTAPEYNMLMCTEIPSSEEEHTQLGEDMLKVEGVLGVSFICDSTETFDEMIGSLDYVVMVMLVCAGALAFVVLYNLTNINIAERKREISTLKVLGFKSTETSAYIYRENLVLTLVGAFAGLLLGIWFLKFVLKTVEIDMLMFGRELHFMSFALAFVLTIVFAVIVNLVMHLRIKKIDMIESLKSVE